VFAICLAVSASTVTLSQPAFSFLQHRVEALASVPPTATAVPTRTPTPPPTARPTSPPTATPLPTLVPPPRLRAATTVLAYPGPPVLARAAYLVDMDTGKVLFRKNANQRLAMASTTKITTAILTLMHAHLGDMVTASKAAATIGETTMALRQGERLSVKDLLYGLLLNSGNDAAVALAEHVGGTQAHFVAMMNGLARKLHLTNTHYVTPHGLDARGHYTSAHDLATVALFAMRNPTFRQIVRTEYFHIPRTRHNLEHYLGNINKALYWYPGADGVKPGQTDNAGLCQVVSAYRNGHHVLAVVLNTPNLATDIRNLLNMGTHDFQWVPSIYAADSPATFQTGGRGAHRWRYYYGAGHYISGPFLAYFDAHGGINRLGLPRTEQIREGGRTVQYFQGGVLELDPHGHSVRADTIGPELARAVAGMRALRGPHAILPGLRGYYHFVGGGKILGTPETGTVWVDGVRTEVFQHGALAQTPYGPRILPAGDAVLRLKGWLPASGAANYYPPSFDPELLSTYTRSHRPS
jgi:D-alanyl-D-alanine carboxypeptidase